MNDDENDLWRIGLLLFLVLITVEVVDGDSLDTDKKVLLDLKSFLERHNQVNGSYSQWNRQNSNPCNWPGILCTSDGSGVNGISLSDNYISGELYGNFSSLTALSYLDLSRNSFSGDIPSDLNNCHNLVYLNLSQNILGGQLNLTGLSNLETLDLTSNRIYGEIGQFSFPANCKLVVANFSENNFTGELDNAFDSCLSLRYLDLSSNLFSGGIWKGFPRLKELLVSKNCVSGEIPGSIFDENCSLEVLDLSVNNFSGRLPKEISKCRHLTTLNLWGNFFTGQIPSEIGSVSSLESLSLGNNSFSPVIPESLLNLSSLIFLDVSRNNFGGDIQEIFGSFTQVKFLLLHSNAYTGGLYSSGILELPTLRVLDLSYNNFSGQLPVEISQMTRLKFLILACNQFNGTILQEYGKLSSLQALDLSFNSLSGSIPATLGNLTSLLWLMLADNMLAGPIPSELGNCNSLLWLNLANNQLSGSIPEGFTNIGSNPTPTFQSNQRSKIIAGFGECLTMKRWIPADYPPFSFVYSVLTHKSCKNIWEKLLTGSGIFQVCAAGSAVRVFQISGYVQLSGNKLSGQVPQGIGKMQNFSMFHLGFNAFYGQLPPQIGQLPLVVLNLTRNMFSGEIPTEIGNIRCVQNLDLSYNNFSGKLPASMNTLFELSKFNISYNPFISGVVPKTGQLATFEKDSYLGDPLLILPKFISNTADQPSKGPVKEERENKKEAEFLKYKTIFLASFSFFFILSFLFFKKKM